MALSRRRTEMAREHHKPEEIVAKPRQVDVLVSQGQAVADAIRSIGVTEVTCYRRWREFGGGECQASCRMACVMTFIYAASPFRVFDWLWAKAAWITASRSGLSVTAAIGVQLRV